MKTKEELEQRAKDLEARFDEATTFNNELNEARSVLTKLQGQLRKIMPSIYSPGEVNAEDVECPYCGQAPGDPCKTNKGEMAKSMHNARPKAAIKQEIEKNYAEIKELSTHIREQINAAKLKYGYANGDADNIDLAVIERELRQARKELENWRPPGEDSVLDVTDRAKVTVKVSNWTDAGPYITVCAIEGISGVHHFKGGVEAFIKEAERLGAKIKYTTGNDQKTVARGPYGYAIIG